MEGFVGLQATVFTQPDSCDYEDGVGRTFASTGHKVLTDAAKPTADDKPGVAI
ncbi:hypothetical protein KEM56_002023 [Ascosphaera pollenicola]|nr:hypothetical protein KEM56_002023 [Ascosphaera pollenicola]